MDDTEYKIYITFLLDITVKMVGNAVKQYYFKQDNALHLITSEI
jgi:hypothetical protein